MLILYSFIV